MASDRGAPGGSPPDTPEIERVNRAFYDGLYGGHGPMGHLVRARLSFDQRSKAGPNLRMLGQVLSSIEARGEERPRLLDYGCGWGTLLLSLARRSLELYGYDLSVAAVPGVNAAASLLSREVNEPPRDHRGRLRASSMDIIVCSHVLEHVPDDEALLDEFRNALSPGGWLLVNVPVNEVVHDPKHIRRYTQSSLERLLENAGFRVVDRRVTDRWTSLLLRWGEGRRRSKRLLTRALRGALAIPPWPWVEALGERLLAQRHPRQQLVVLCERRDHE